MIFQMVRTCSNRQNNGSMSFRRLEKHQIDPKIVKIGWKMAKLLYWVVSGTPARSLGSTGNPKWLLMLRGRIFAYSATHLNPFVCTYVVINGLCIHLVKKGPFGPIGGPKKGQCAGLTLGKLYSVKKDYLGHSKTLVRKFLLSGAGGPYLLLD